MGSTCGKGIYPSGQNLGMSVSFWDGVAHQNTSRRVALNLAVAVVLSILRAFLRLCVAKNACSPENEGYFSASRTKAEPLRVSLMIVTTPFAFGVIGAPGTGGIGVRSEAGWRLQPDQGGQRNAGKEPRCQAREAMVIAA